MSDTTHFADYELGIYLQGMLSGAKPDLPMTLAELERLAKEKIDPRAFGYVAGGAGLEDTVAENRRAFERWRIMPHMCRDTSSRNWSTTVLGTKMPAPLMLAPVGVQEIVHPEAELAVARGASSLGVPIVLSSLSSYTLEQVAEAMGDTPRWFQLYPPKDLAVAESFIHRAEKAGYSAIVITVDTRFIGWRARDLQDAYLPFLEGKGIANYTSDPAFCAPLDAPPSENMMGAVGRWTEIYADAAQSWADFKRMREMTSLPVLIKGILHPDDARRAVSNGFSGIIVSNHGGRQVDGAISSLDALPGIVGEVGLECAILLDSGIRCGADMVKAIALGASAVLIGRPYAWGLAVAGEHGVREVIQRFLAEFDLTLALSGISRREEITKEILRRVT
jgi:lactate 2-monooxygenase